MPHQTTGSGTGDEQRVVMAVPPTSSLTAPRHLPKKSLGQHFLKDRSVPPRIADAANLLPGDFVVEVGPGLGVLTEEIARRLDPSSGRLIAVELDGNLLPVLEQRFAGQEHVSFLHGDVLEMDPATLAGDRPYKVVANLPYYITSAILRHFLEASGKPRSLTVMVQREVAERMVATPPDMSLLAVSVQFYGKPKIMFRVPPGAFNPPPKVDSAVVHIEVYPSGENPLEGTSEFAFFRVAHAGFSQKRKQLGNTLATGLDLPKDYVAARLAETGVAPSRRAETLTLSDWARICQALEHRPQASTPGQVEDKPPPC
ncbi:MAG TPA: 16S rRNA (adenine(1518)-N(6)/adenine(1519)-N(6))-dimethyltransferase RsmA [Chloroflexia bacterium]|nr:16S rRNA (adenine(1518)-N(6)/adenine(1519)-N(6))-dimethyltransferase RsmA [Chloroflexia bacterium]